MKPLLSNGLASLEPKELETVLKGRLHQAVSLAQLGENWLRVKSLAEDVLQLRASDKTTSDPIEVVFLSSFALFCFAFQGSTSTTPTGGGSGAWRYSMRIDYRRPRPSVSGPWSAHDCKAKTRRPCSGSRSLALSLVRSCLENG